MTKNNADNTKVKVIGHKLAIYRRENDKIISIIKIYDDQKKNQDRIRL